MSTIYICRHGETENNRHGRISGWIDSPLTPEGLQATLAVAAKLRELVPITFACSSDLGRAFITAYTITRQLGFSDEIVRMSGFRECNYGDLAFQTYESAEAIHPGLNRETNFVPPAGESLKQMQQRALKALAELDKQHKDDTILLVTHDGVIKALRASITGENLGKLNISFAYPHDFVACLTVKDGKLENFEELD